MGAERERYLCPECDDIEALGGGYKCGRCGTPHPMRVAWHTPTANDHDHAVTHVLTDGRMTINHGSGQRCFACDLTTDEDGSRGSTGHSEPDPIGDFLMFCELEVPYWEDMPGQATRWREYVRLLKAARSAAAARRRSATGLSGRQ